MNIKFTQAHEKELKTYKKRVELYSEDLENRDKEIAELRKTIDIATDTLWKDTAEIAEKDKRIAELESKSSVHEPDVHLEDGKPCSHKGCLSHITHPCEGCGRIAGRTVFKSFPDKRYKALVEKQSEYIKLLGQELDEVVSMASLSGWQSGRYDLGVKLRTEIRELKQSITQSEKE